MKCLSMREPWLTAVLRYGKTVENRKWAPKFRGTILLHASTSMDDEYYLDACGWMLDHVGLEVDCFDRSKLFSGVIVGQAELVDVIYKGAKLLDATSVAHQLGADIRWWMPEQNGLILRNVRIYERPIPYKGMPSLFEVSKELVPEAA